LNQSGLPAFLKFLKVSLILFKRLLHWLQHSFDSLLTLLQVLIGRVFVPVQDLFGDLKKRGLIVL
jgi:hypothetical protein